MQSIFSEIVSAGVDYITGSSPGGANAVHLECVGQRWLDEERRAGNDIHEFFTHGYSGLGCGSVQLAKNGKSVFVRLSGREAYDHRAEVAKASSKVSRIDFQVTVRLKREMKSFAERVERSALSYERKHNHDLGVRLLRDSRTGKTVYLGSKRSNRMGRFYDKGAESKLPEFINCWRGEWQFGGTLSTLQAMRLLGVDDTTAAVIRIVHQESKRVGVFWPDVLGVPLRLAQLLIPPRGPTDSTRRLMWLHAQVKPTVERELALGHRGLVMRALGLLEDNQEVT